MHKEMLKNAADGELVDELVKLDKQVKELSKQADAVKAELQSRAIGLMEDRNVKYVRYYGVGGNVSVVDAQSLDVINIDKLKEAVGEGVFNSKVTETIEPKYKYDKKFERMLKAVFTGDYTFEYELEEFLTEQMGVTDPKQAKTLLKKLKGEFEADRKTLTSVLYPDPDIQIPDLDTELWYIYRIKNAELIKAFLPDEFLDDTIENIKKSLIVDVKTAIKLDYEKE